MALNANQVLTGKVRFSYAHVFEPKAAQNGGDPKYSVTLLLPKSDKATYGRIKAAIEAAKEAFRAKNPKGLPANGKIAMHDGDGPMPNGGEYGPECAGCYVINASSKNPPTVIDAFKNEIMNKTELYSGCYGRAILSLYGYDTNGNKGVAFGLEAVQKLEDGEPLGGSRVSADDFDDLDDLLG